ncbi:MAG: eyespot assembly ABC1 kinase family [Trebouxia sp. A1-2]|nr:MAG: eyespot assembly ABC1 kinase family [Trebouxia sp. A1-2]
MNYLLEIERLQDRVPPFPTQAALLVMAKAFGQPVDEVFNSLSTAPVASASLGQVYKGRLRDIYGGGEVAVKVQRPSVQASVALDLLLMRRFAAFCQTFPQIRTNWVGLIDEWATRFFHELDYEREAQNGMTFKEQMAGLDGIVVADVYQHLSNKEVLTTVWIQGEKLSESTAGDVRELCTTLLNCYLIQLLETGFLHADPHPGNLIRTPEGQICILDFGLMTEVTPEQSLALVEYIAHLSVEDWNGIALDLRKLGFVPADAPEMAELGLIAPLGNILSQLSQGGGAKGINIDAVTIALDELSKDYPIDIPPYFALILRAFSVIEGTALRVDPDYAIVKETFPYLSRRLLTDNQPRARAALRQLLYGDKARLDITRLQRLSSGFGNFTTSGIMSTSPHLTAPALDDTSREVLKIVFNRNGSYLQELLVDELVAGADAVGREAVSEVCRVVLGTPPALATFGTLQALGPLRLVLAPFPTPFEVLYSLQPAVAPNDEDQEALLTVRGIWSILQPNFRQQLDGNQRQRVWEEIYPLLPELLPGLSLIAEMFARQLLARVALRAAEELQRPPRRYDHPSEWTDKIKRYTQLEHLQIKPNPKKAASPLVAVQSEGEKVLKLITPQAGDRGVANLVFCIGGPYGHGMDVRSRANETMKLSDMVLNHQIAHMVLLEQIYRAWTILRGEPYHH